MKLNNQIISEIKNLKGKILGFGITDEKIMNALDKNKKIQEYNLLNLKGFSDDTSEESGKLKYISISKLRKKFKKKKTDNIIAVFEEINQFKTTFIKDSIYLTKEKIFLLIDDKKDYEKIMKGYKRYKSKVQTEKCTDGFLLTIDVSKVKSTKQKDLKYHFLESIDHMIEIISDIMTT